MKSFGKFFGLQAVCIAFVLSLLIISTVSAQDAVATNPDLFRILLDNERVRVLDQNVAAGRRENMHSHPAVLKYTLSSYRATVSYPNGSSTSMRRINPGQVMFFEPETHSLKNSGRTNMHTIMFELKGAHIVQSEKPQVSDDPLVTAAKSHKLLFENDRVRVLQFRLKPKEETPAHHHGDGVVYVQNGGTLSETLQDGKSHDVTLTTHDVKWMDAKTHKVKNTGTDEIRMLIVELKD